MESQTEETLQTLKEAAEDTPTRVGKFTVTKAEDTGSNNLHIDKNFFDPSLLEIKTQYESKNASDYKVWIKRAKNDQKRPVKEAKKTSIFDPHNQTIGYGHLDDRRKSTDDQIHYQQTIHGTSGISRRLPLFSSFRHKKPKTPQTPESKRPSFMQNVKAAFNTKTFNRHPIQISNAKAHLPGNNYATVSGPSPSRRPGPITKMIDIFLSKPMNHYQETNQQTVPRSAQNHKKTQKIKENNVWKMRRIPEPFLDPNKAALNFKLLRGLSITSPYLKTTEASSHNADVLINFFKFHKCYDLIPKSAKLIVFDTKLSVKKAFFALVYNGVRSAPLWESKTGTYIGLLTITDFMRILLKHYKSANVTLEDLEEHTLEAWRKDLKEFTVPLMFANPDDSLYDAIKQLIANRIHRLLVLDEIVGNALYVLTLKRILKFLFYNMNDLPRPTFLNLTLSELKIGTYDDIETVSEDTTVVVALRKLVDRRISSLPVVDCDGKLTNIYAKCDVINLAAKKTYNDLDVSLKDANSYRNEWFEGVQKCTIEETLFNVIERIVVADVHRIVVVDKKDCVVGIVSISDLLKFLIMDNEPSDS